jgi:hypothetical protein
MARAVATGGAAMSSSGGPQDHPPPENSVRRVWMISAPRGLLDPAIATMHYFTATHHRLAHATLESASPVKRGDSHSKYGCSMDVRTVGGGYGRWLISIHVPGYNHRKKPGKWLGKLFSAATRALAFSLWLSRSPPHAFDVTGDLD